MKYERRACSPSQICAQTVVGSGWDGGEGEGENAQRSVRKEVRQFGGDCALSGSLACRFGGASLLAFTPRKGPVPLGTVYSKLPVSYSKGTVLWYCTVRHTMVSYDIVATHSGH